jgi:hypothetical protein
VRSDVDVYSRDERVLLADFIVNSFTYLTSGLGGNGHHGQASVHEYWILGASGFSSGFHITRLEVLFFWVCFRLQSL